MMTIIGPNLTPRMVIYRWFLFPGLPGNPECYTEFEEPEKHSGLPDKEGDSVVGFRKMDNW